MPWAAPQKPSTCPRHQTPSPTPVLKRCQCNVRSAGNLAEPHGFSSLLLTTPTFLQRAVSFIVSFVLLSIQHPYNNLELRACVSYREAGREYKGERHQASHFKRQPCPQAIAIQREKCNNRDGAVCGRRECGRTCTREQALRKTTEAVWAGSTEPLSLGWDGTALASALWQGLLWLPLVAHQLFQTQAPCFSVLSDEPHP